MIINTKYNVGDSIYTMSLNKIIEGEVRSIQIKEFENNINYPINGHIGYAIKTKLGSMLENRFFSENTIFKTKEELIQSL